MIDFGFGINSESVFGLGEASFTIGTDLDGVFGAEKNCFSFDVFLFSKTKSDSFGMIETTAPDMIGGSR